MPGIPKFPPGLPKLPDGSPWREVTLTGDGAVCARGVAYAVFVHDGDPKKVILNFGGGGACSTAETCDVTNPTFFPDLTLIRLLLTSNLGVFKEGSADNPFDGWTHVVIPNCTGDLNLGGNDVTYTRKDGTAFEIKHRGANNTKAALAWVGDHFKQDQKSPDKVVVVGSSAGAYGAVMWTPAVQELFPKARVRLLADCGAGVHDLLSSDPPFPSQWNIAASMPAWVPGLDPATADIQHLDTNEIYVREAQHYPQVEFTQFNYNRDQIQSYFFMRTGGDILSWSPRLYASMAYLSLTIPNNFRNYLASGDGHAILVGDDLYTTTVNDVKFSRWLTDFLAEKPLTDEISFVP